ncbi:diguanylate cyclase [Pontibacterium sp. N1Y112]|uniref:diguanylate cyclase n=1 Tax=Pontibacterium sinense TaxID=2781979 RepID=A0A8J7FU27_9GAMM|nr:diguanylate cyclase [Pontibacterium sinense]MBE9399507.1 diguanylate cyclase [Pontibacterium sinense]
MIDTQTCLSRHLHPSIDISKWQRTVDLMSQLFDSACGTIVQFRQQEFNAVVASLNEGNFLQRDSSWPWEMKSFCRTIIETGEGLYVRDAPNEDKWKDADPVKDGPVRSYLGMPITWPDGTLFGTICVIDTKSSDYQSNQIELLEQFRDMIDADLRMMFAYEEIKTLALTDEMTGVSNRRGLKVLGAQRIKDAKRFGLSIGIAYLDIDNLKALNDEHGHQAGDVCISTLAQAMKNCCRENDIIARLGGDEFVVMLLTDTHDHLQVLCQRLENEFNRLCSESDILSDSGISYGYCCRHGNHPISLDTLIEEADRSMYKHKKAKKPEQYDTEAQ